jgi:hypothetical protein
MINRRNEARGLITRTIIGVKGKAKVGENGIEKTQTAEANEAEFQEQELIELLHCQCGAVLRTAEEVGAIDCVTAEFLCIECAKVRCSRCLKAVGVESRKSIFGQTYCKRCARRLIIIAVIACLLVAVSVFFLIFR